MELTNKLTAIADAIRAKTGKSEKFTLTQMTTEIDSIISSPDGSDVAFGSSDSISGGQYAISAEIMNAIVAEIQKMSGRTKPLTPKEMLYWLRRVVYIPQGYAESEFAVQYDFSPSTATGRIPVYQKGTAESTFIMPIGMFSSTAVGEVIE